jgi:histidine ammonia-lyase
VPSQGSVGASGDLAPLGHLSAAMLGEGRIALKGEVMPAGEALRTLGLEPLSLGPKEGIALLNGTQISTAIALDALFTAERVFGSALVSGALSVDALKGTDAAYDPRLHQVRGQPGQIAVASVLKSLLDGSPIKAFARRLRQGAGSLQLPLPAAGDGRLPRSDPQRRAHAAIEANAVTDNPVVFPDGRALSGRQLSTPSRLPSPRTCWPWRCARSDRSPSGGRRCWSIRR